MKSIIISHRGNLEGSDPKTENTNAQIKKVLNQGFNVEVDVWFKDAGIYLGHDEPKERLDYDILYRSGVWYHCKNIEAMEFFLDKGNCDFFFHDKDDVALTNNKYLWTYSGKALTVYSIAVLPEKANGWNIKKACGICTDYPKHYGTLLS